jgi:hypothetical protein
MKYIKLNNAFYSFYDKPNYNINIFDNILIINNSK